MSWRDRAIADSGKGDGSWRARALPDEPQEDGPKTGAGEAALESFGNSATLGYLPHIQAAAEGLTPDPSADVDEQLRAQGFNISEDDNSYVTRRDRNLKRQKLQGEEHPVASGIGTGAGILATALVPGKAIAKGASLAEKAIRGGKAGLVMGALVNPGDTEGVVDPLQLEGRAKNAAMGGALGAAAPIAVQGAVKGSQKVADYLRNKAALKATRALGRPTPTKATKMANSGQDVTIGRELLDEGAIPVLGTPKRIAGRVEKLKEKAGQEIGDLVDSAGSAKVVDSEKIAIEILDSPELKQMRMTPGMESTVAAIEKQVETLAKNGQLTVKEAQALRQGIDKSINFNKAAPEMRGAQEGLYQQRTAVRNAMNDGINSLPGSTSKDALLKANRKYGNMSQAEEILEKEIGRNQANRAVSLTDTIAAAGGLTTGNPLAALALGGLNKAGRTVGNSVQARVFDAISKKAASAAGAGAKIDPKTLAHLGNRSATLTPDVEDDPDPIINDNRLMDLFRKDPSLIEAINDERTKKKIKRALSSDR